MSFASVLKNVHKMRECCAIEAPVYYLPCACNLVSHTSTYIIKGCPRLGWKGDGKRLGHDETLKYRNDAATEEVCVKSTASQSNARLINKRISSST